MGHQREESYSTGPWSFYSCDHLSLLWDLLRVLPNKTLVDTCHHPREWQGVNKEPGDIQETLEVERKIVGETESHYSSWEAAEIDQVREDQRLTDLGRFKRYLRGQGH